MHLLEQKCRLQKCSASTHKSCKLKIKLWVKARFSHSEELRSNVKIWYQISRENLNPEAVAQRCSVKKVFLEITQNSQENTCARVSFVIKLQAETCNFIKKETLAQVFSCEFCEISKKTFFTEHLWTTAFVNLV